MVRPVRVAETLLTPEARLALRWDFRAQRFPPDATCRCGEVRGYLFVEGIGRPTCYRCARVAEGRSAYEWHHLGGRPSPWPPVAIPANLHRILSDLQDVFWRDHVEPGSVKAVAFDVVALVALGSQWLIERGVAL